MCGESGKSRNGTVHHYYKCVSVKKKRTNCKKKAVRKQWLEELVVTEVMKVVMDDKAIEAIVSQVMDLQDRENTTLPVLETELREVESGIQNILNAIQMGILTKSSVSQPAFLIAACQNSYCFSAGAADIILLTPPPLDMTALWNNPSLNGLRQCCWTLMAPAL